MKKRSNAKLIAMLTAFLMVFAMMPLVAFGEEASEAVYDLWVGDSEEVTATGTILDTGATEGTATVSIEGNRDDGSAVLVLKLNDFKYTGVGHDGFTTEYGTEYGVIWYDGQLPLRIELTGDNVVAQKGSEENTVSRGSYGIQCYANNDLTITGKGKLTASSDEVKINSNVQAHSEGIDASGLFIENTSLTAKGAKASSPYVGESAGINVGGVTIKDSNVIASGDEAYNSYGISCDGAIVSGSNLTATGGAATNISYGVDVGSGTITINEDVKKVEISGNKKAIRGKVINELTGTGWADVAGTGDGTEISVNTEGAAYDFRKVQFVKGYDLWVGGEQVTADHLSGVSNVGDKGGWTFDPATYTLTLDNYTYTGAGIGTRGIYSSNPEYSDTKLTIILKGTNTITVSKDSYAYNESHTCEGIQVYRPLEIKGGDTDELNIHAKGVTNNNAQLKGIDVTRGNLTISGGTVNAVAYACEYHGNGVVVEQGNAYINGGTLIAKGNSIDWSEGTSSGIKTSKLHISKNAKEVTAIGEKKAIIGTVINEMPGKGWTDVEGNGEGTLIEKYSGTGDGYNFNEEPYSDYKKVIFEPVHEHSFTYAAGTGENANKITATCTGNLDCREGYKDNPITITLNKPTDLTYDATAKAASITEYPSTTVENLAPEPAIEYYKSTGEGSTTVSGNALEGAPVNAGDYVAQITWGDNASSATASVAFSIAKAPLTITAKDQTCEYNGQLQGPGDIIYESDFDKYVICEGLKGSDALTGIELFWQAKDIGVYKDSITVKSAKVNNLNEDDGNYVITYVPGTVTIVSKKPSNVSGAPVTNMKAGKTSMTIAWEKTEGVDGYDIFFSRCNHGDKKVTLKNVKTISGNNTFVWKNSGLKKGTCYKAYVKAYIMTGSGKKYVKTSPLMHAYTGKGTKKYTNAKSVKVNKTSVSLNAGKTFKLKAKVKKLKKNKKLMPKSHVATVRYLSTDTKIATVTSKGKIKGIKKGTCYVYAYAHNGVYKKVKVTVK